MISLSALIWTKIVIFIPIFLYSYILIFLYSYILIFPYFYIPIFLYSYIPIFLYSYILIFLYSYIPIFLYTYIPIFLYTYIPIFLYTYIPIFLYSYIPIRCLLCIYISAICNHNFLRIAVNTFSFLTNLQDVICKVEFVFQIELITTPLGINNQEILMRNFSFVKLISAWKYNKISFVVSFKYILQFGCYIYITFMIYLKMQSFFYCIYCRKEERRRLQLWWTGSWIILSFSQ